MSNSQTEKEMMDSIETCLFDSVELLSDKPSIKNPKVIGGSPHRPKIIPPTKNVKLVNLTPKETPFMMAVQTILNQMIQQREFLQQQLAMYEMTVRNIHKQNIQLESEIARLNDIVDGLKDGENSSLFKAKMDQLMEQKELIRLQKEEIDKLRYQIDQKDSIQCEAKSDDA